MCTYPVSYTHLLKVTPTTRKISMGTRFRVGTYLYTVESAETEEGVWCICAEEAGTGPSVSSGTALPVTYVPGLQSAVVTGIKEAGKELSLIHISSGEGTEVNAHRIFFGVSCLHDPFPFCVKNISVYISNQPIL